MRRWKTGSWCNKPCSTAAASSFTPHLGCFEIVAQQIALRTPLTVMYRPPKRAA
jgi:hypothetical protein